MKKRVYAIIMVLIMIITLIPLNVSASTNDIGLFLRYSDWNNGPVENLNNELQSYYRNAPGYNNPLFFYFVEDGKEVRLSAADLTVSNNILKLYASSENADAVMVELLDFGSTTINYEKNGVIYSLNVDVMIPDVGFYSSSVASQGAFIRNFTVTNTEDTFYLVATNGWKLTNVVSIEAEDYADVQILNDKACVSITITGNPESGSWFALSFNCKYANGYITSHEYGLEIINSVCMHKTTKLVDEKTVGCTIDGYTGNEVCTACGVRVKKGEVIKATGHKYVNGICTNCQDKVVIGKPVEDVDTSKPLEEVKESVSEGVIEEIQKEIESGNRITTEIVTDVIKESEIESNTVEMIKDKIGENGKVVQYLDLSVLIKSVSAEGTETVPETGDDRCIILWGIYLMISFCVVLVVGKKRCSIK